MILIVAKMAEDSLEISCTCHLRMNFYRFIFARNEIGIYLKLYL